VGRKKIGVKCRAGRQEEGNGDCEGEVGEEWEETRLWGEDGELGRKDGGLRSGKGAPSQKG